MVTTKTRRHEEGRNDIESRAGHLAFSVPLLPDIGRRYEDNNSGFFVPS